MVVLPLALPQVHLATSRLEAGDASLLALLAWELLCSFTLGFVSKSALWPFLAHFP